MSRIVQITLADKSSARIELECLRNASPTLRMLVDRACSNQPDNPVLGELFSDCDPWAIQCILFDLAKLRPKGVNTRCGIDRILELHRVADYLQVSVPSWITIDPDDMPSVALFHVARTQYAKYDMFLLVDDEDPVLLESEPGNWQDPLKVGWGSLNQFRLGQTGIDLLNSRLGNRGIVRTLEFRDTIYSLLGTRSIEGIMFVNGKPGGGYKLADPFTGFQTSEDTRLFKTDMMEVLMMYFKVMNKD
jgi:hypothetical protein